MRRGVIAGDCVLGEQETQWQYVEPEARAVGASAIDSAIAAAEEQAKREADEAKIADAKLSAQAKLAKLGLTGDEISALTK